MREYKCCPSVKKDFIYNKRIHGFCKLVKFIFEWKSQNLFLYIALNMTPHDIFMVGKLIIIVFGTISDYID